MIKVTALGKVSQTNFSFYQNISKKEGINIQWSIPTLLPTPYIRHHKKKEKGTALPLPDWPQTPPHLRDELKRENTLNVWIRLATFCVQRRRCGQTKRGRGAEEYKKVKQRWLSCSSCQCHPMNPQSSAFRWISQKTTVPWEAGSNIQNALKYHWLKIFIFSMLKGRVLKGKKST